VLGLGLGLDALDAGLTGCMMPIPKWHILYPLLAAGRLIPGYLCRQPITLARYSKHRCSWKNVSIIRRWWRLRLWGLLCFICRISAWSGMGRVKDRDMVRVRVRVWISISGLACRHSEVWVHLPASGWYSFYHSTEGRTLTESTKVAGHIPRMVYLSANSHASKS